MAARSRRIALCGLIVSLLIGCTTQQVPRVVKIGLVAPFEGRYREIGSDVIPAVRLALREWMDEHPGDIAPYELVAYDDLGDPDIAIEQAQKLVADPEVAVVIGHWRDVTSSAAVPVYEAAGLPFITYSTDDLEGTEVWNLSPAQNQLAEAVDHWSESAQGLVIPLVNSQPTIQLDVDQMVTARFGAYATDTIVVGGPAWGLSQFPLMVPERVQNDILFVSGLAVPDESVDMPQDDATAFTLAYREGSLGIDPGPYAIAAYQAAQFALLIASGQLDQSGADTASSLLFDTDGRRLDAPIYLYRWASDTRQLVQVLSPNTPR
jgi:hypothetical protein